MAAATGPRSLRTAAGRAAGSDTFEYLARTGYAVSGVLHLLIAYIVARLAFTGAAGSADQSGALATLGTTTGGAAALWIAAAGLVALALWHIAETVRGPTGRGEGSHLRGRVSSASLAVVNFAIAVSAARFATGSGQASTEQNVGMSAQLMQSGWGRALLIAVGVGVAAVGAYHVYKGASENFRDELRISGGTLIRITGLTGYVAKGLVLAGAGILAVVATLRTDPAKASGLDAAVRTLGQAPFGKVLLVLAALGIAAFGVYSLIRSRHAEM